MKTLISNWALLSLFFVLVLQNTNAQTAQQEAEAMLALVNNLRADNGITPLTLNTELNQAAFDHAEDMATNDYFSHIGLNGSSISDRVTASGYTGSSIGENLAAGYSAVANTFNQWLNSTTHLNNMLNVNADEMGLGHATFSGSTYTHYWTQLFGKSAVLAVEDLELAKNFSVYPNPVKDMLYLNLKNMSEEDFIVNIINVNGQNVYHKSMHQYPTDYTLNLSHLPTGIYFLYAENLPVQKVIKY